MKASHAAGIVALIVVAGAVGAVAMGGLSGTPADGPTSGDSTAPDSGETGPSGDGESSSDTETNTTADMTDTNASFAFGIDAIEECGTTCRDVTATLSNDGDGDAANVTVTTNIYADGDLIWEGQETVGDLAAGEAFSSTQRVELGYAEALAIENNDGWITVETIVTFDDGREVFVEERQVA